MASTEVVRGVAIPPGQNIHIRRGDLAGWIAEVGHGPNQPFTGRAAAFSNADDLLKWLALCCGIETSADGATS